MVQRTARHYCWRRCFKHTRLAQRDNIFSYLQQTSLSETQLLIDYLNEGQADRYAYASNVSEAMDKFDMDIPNTTMVIREFKEFSGTLNPRILINNTGKT